MYNNFKRSKQQTETICEVSLAILLYFSKVESREIVSGVLANLTFLKTYHRLNIYPSCSVLPFNREVKICIPNSQSINRGNLRIDELVDACRKADFTDVIMVRSIYTHYSNI